MPERYPAAREVVRRDLDSYAVALKHTDAEAPHVAGESGEHFVPRIDRNAESRVGEHLDNGAFQLDCVLFSHRPRIMRAQGYRRQMARYPYGRVY